MRAALLKELMSRAVAAPLLASMIAVPVAMEYGSCAMVNAKLRQEFCILYLVNTAYYLPVEMTMFLCVPGTSLWMSYPGVILDPIFFVFQSVLTARRLAPAGEECQPAPSTPVDAVARSPAEGEDGEAGAEA